VVIQRDISAGEAELAGSSGPAIICRWVNSPMPRHASSPTEDSLPEGQLTVFKDGPSRTGGNRPNLSRTGSSEQCGKARFET
jgi:hypothetical protein